MKALLSAFLGLACCAPVNMGSRPTSTDPFIISGSYQYIDDVRPPIQREARSEGAYAATARPPVPVEVRRGGDDGLTVRFADALEAALTQSPAFTPSTSGQPAMLVAEIPTNLEWTRAGGDIQVHFVVNFRRADSRLLRTSSGTCWEARLDICVGHALSDAQRALGSR